MNPKDKLSKYFTLEELIATSPSNQIRLSQLGLNNIPNQSVITNLTTIAKLILDPIRDYIGGPLAVTSGYRSPALNQIIGGADASQHIVGCACDLDAHVYGVGTNAQIFWYIVNHLPFDQVIWEFGNDDEPDWVHVSFVDPIRNRKKVTKAIRQNGQVKYLPYEH